MVKEKRNVMDLWIDKRMMIFFRENFENIHYKNLRSIYAALCEIDSDFPDGIIPNFTKTVAEYAGMYKNTVGPYLKAMKIAKIINYFQETENNGQYGETRLILFKWEEADKDETLLWLKRGLKMEE